MGIVFNHTIEQDYLLSLQKKGSFSNEQKWKSILVTEFWKITHMGMREI